MCIESSFKKPRLYPHEHLHDDPEHQNDKQKEDGEQETMSQGTRETPKKPSEIEQRTPGETK